MNRARRLRLLLAAWALAAAQWGCARPMTEADIVDPQLRAINQHFTRIIQDMHDDPHVQWHSGWFGNVLVNYGDTDDQGLCYQWQREVYRRVLPEVQRQGWAAVGIGKNRRTMSEHHAVIVFDPSRIQPEQLLNAPRDRPAWVLDGWRRGKPDIYPLADWISRTWVQVNPPVLENLDAWSENATQTPARDVPNVSDAQPIQPAVR